MRSPQPNDSLRNSLRQSAVSFSSVMWLMNTCIFSMRVPALAFLCNGGTISLNPHILPCQLYARVGWTIAHDEKTPGLPGIQVYPSRSKPQKDLRGFVTANAPGSGIPVVPGSSKVVNSF